MSIILCKAIFCFSKKNNWKLHDNENYILKATIFIFMSCRDRSLEMNGWYIHFHVMLFYNFYFKFSLSKSSRNYFVYIMVEISWVLQHISTHLAPWDVESMNGALFCKSHLHIFRKFPNISSLDLKGRVAFLSLYICCLSHINLNLKGIN